MADDCAFTGWSGSVGIGIIAGTTTATEVLVSAAAGYAFARMKFPGRQAMFMLLLATMMIPGVVTLIPAFILFRRLAACRRDKENQGLYTDNRRFSRIYCKILPKNPWRS